LSTERNQTEKVTELDRKQMTVNNSITHVVLVV